MTLYYSKSLENPPSSSSNNPVKAVTNVINNSLKPFTDVLKREKNENQDVDLNNANNRSPIVSRGEDTHMPLKRRYILIMNKLESIENLLILILIILTIIMFKNFN